MDRTEEYGKNENELLRKLHYIRQSKQPPATQTGDTFITPFQGRLYIVIGDQFAGSANSRGRPF